METTHWFWNDLLFYFPEVICFSDQFCLCMHFISLTLASPVAAVTKVTKIPELQSTFLCQVLLDRSSSIKSVKKRWDKSGSSSFKINNTLALVLYKMNTVFITPMYYKGSTLAANVTPQVCRIWLWCFIPSIIYVTKGMFIWLRKVCTEMENKYNNLSLTLGCRTPFGGTWLFLQHLGCVDVWRVAFHLGPKVTDLQPEPLFPVPVHSGGQMTDPAVIRSPNTPTRTCNWYWAEKHTRTLNQLRLLGYTDTLWEVLVP